MLRKLSRSIARRKMRDSGVTRINKKDSKGKSFFSRHWREWVLKKIKTPKKAKVPKKAKLPKRRSA